MKLILFGDFCFISLSVWTFVSCKKSLKKKDRKQWPTGKRTKGQTIILQQNTTKTTKDRVTRTPLKYGGEPRCSRGTSVFIANDARLDL